MKFTYRTSSVTWAILNIVNGNTVLGFVIDDSKTVFEAWLAIIAFLLIIVGITIISTNTKDNE